MTMSEKAKAEYERAMMAATVKHGSLVSLDASIYGWEEYSWNGGNGQHLAKCGAVVQDNASVQEDTWDEFQGTFYEGDTSVHGVTVTGVTCNCGRIGTNRRIRWKASMQEVAEAVFEEAFGS